MEDTIINSEYMSNLVSIFNKVLKNIILNNPSNSHKLTIFDAYTNLSLKEYILQCVNYLNIQPSILIYSFCLIDRIFKKGIVLTKSNRHRLFFTSLVISIKMNMDCPFSDKELAYVGRLKLEDYVKLEAYFLETVNFQTYITRKLFDKYRKALILI